MSGTCGLGEVKDELVKGAQAAFRMEAGHLTANMQAAIEQTVEAVAKRLKEKTVDELRDEYFLVRRSWRTNAAAVGAVVAALLSFAGAILTAWGGLKASASEAAKSAVIERVANLEADGAVGRIEAADRMLQKGDALDRIGQLEFYSKRAVNELEEVAALVELTMKAVHELRGSPGMTPGEKAVWDKRVLDAPWVHIHIKELSEMVKDLWPTTLPVPTDHNEAGSGGSSAK